MQQITAVLDGYSSSDVLVITEYRPNKNGKAIRAILAEKGYGHQFDTVTEEKKNGVVEIGIDDNARPSRPKSDEHGRDAENKKNSVYKPG